MSLLKPSVDVTAKDFQALRLRLQGLARSVYPEWTDFNTPNFGNLLLEMFAYTGDVVTFYQDNQGREAFWPTVKQRENAIRLGRAINYVMASSQPSTGSVRFYIPSAAVLSIPIPEGTRVRTQDANPVVFRTKTAAAIGVGNTFVDVEVEQAEVVSNEGFASTGGPNQRYLTLQSPVIDNTLTVVAEDGTYLQVDSFLDPDPITSEAIDENSRVFIARGDAFDRSVLIFGNGQVGRIPEGSVTIGYKIGGGTAGNVEAGEIRAIDSQLYDAGSNIAQVSVTNPVRMTGGVPRVSVAEAAQLAPASLRTLERSVTKDDFETGALEVPSVARAVMVTSNEDGSVPENEGVLLVVAKGDQLASGRIESATPSQTTLAAVLAKVTVERPPTLTFSVTAEAATLREINHSTRVYLTEGALPEVVGPAIRASIEDFYAAQLEDGTANPDIDFGANLKANDGSTVAEIAWSNVYNAIRDTEGVRKVDEGPQGLLLNGLRSSITLGAREFPVPGTITITDGDTGEAL